jgi:Uma2 family endonuclease
MNPTTALLTADDLLNLPKDSERHELVKGELRTMPPAGFEHGAVGLNLAAPLDAYAKGKQLGVVVAAETGFLIERSPDTVRAPDIGFVRKDRLPQGNLPRQYFPGPPDLAVEIISPWDKMNEVDEKVQDWLTSGTTMVWIVNPRQKTVTVYHAQRHPVILTADDYLEGLDVVPGFRILVRDIFV